MTPTVGDLFFSLGRVVLTFGDMRLTRGIGSHVLALPVTVSTTWLGTEAGENAPLLISGQVYFENPGMQPVGALRSQVWAVRGYSVAEELSMMVTDEQVLSLDAARNGDALPLRVNVSATLLQAPPSVHPTAECQVALRVPGPVWLQCLDQLGTELGLLIRVPTPLADPGGNAAPPSLPGDPARASRAQAATRVRQARNEFRDARYENCVATCRLVLDSLALLVPLPTAKATFTKQPTARSQTERWAAIQHDLHSLLSLAHHDDTVTRASTWNRADAEAVLAIVGSLAARVLIS